MFWRFCLFLFIGVLLEWKLTLSAPAEIGGTKEKGRAYEFGFTIEEQQHRHEKKDENGIVMGEFGFITADGIYHVTVYATDENGKFKIISMKNYPYGNPEKKIMIARIPLAKKPVVTPTVVKAMKPDGKSCGGCVLPKKLNQLPADVMGKKPDGEKAVFRPLSKAIDDVSANGQSNGEANKVGKSTPTTQTKSLSKTTGPSLSSNGKGTMTSKQPSSKLPLIPPKSSASVAKKPNAVGSTSSKTDVPGNNGNKYHQSTHFLTQTTSTPTQHFTQFPGSKSPKSNTQSRVSSRENQLQSKSSDSLPTWQSKSSVYNENLSTPYNKQSISSLKDITKPSAYYTTIIPPQEPHQFKHSLSKTTPNFSPSPQNHKQSESTTQNKSVKSSISRFGSQNQDRKFPPTTIGRSPSPGEGSQDINFLNPSIFSKLPLKPNVSKSFVLPTEQGIFAETLPEKDTNPTLTSPKHSSKPSTTFEKTQTIYNTATLATKNPNKSIGISPSNTQTNTTPQQHFLSSHKKTNPTLSSSTQSYRNNENKAIHLKPLINNRFGFSNEENEFNPNSYENLNNAPLSRPRGNLHTTRLPNSLKTTNNPYVVPTVYNTQSMFPISSTFPNNNPTRSFEISANNRKTPSEILHTTKLPNSLKTSNNPFVVPTVYNTQTKFPIASTFPKNNPTRSFEISASNRKTPSQTSSQQDGPTNTFTQNAVKPILTSTKATKPFQTLSKTLPDSDESIQSRTPQTSSTPLSFTRNTVSQKTGQVLPQVTQAQPKLIGKNTLTQQQSPVQTQTPKRLQQNTNEAKTTTTNTQSTQKQTPAVPSSKAVGKKSSSTNGLGGGSGDGRGSGVDAAPANGGVGVGARGGSSGSGGGPLYRFKYVLDYNSHREEGRIDGSKEGKYNTIDEDGVRRIIDYIANENGYQPYVKVERPPPNELPTGENKLKEYEFVWFN